MNCSRIAILVDSKIVFFGNIFHTVFIYFAKLSKRVPDALCKQHAVLGYATVEVSLTTGSLRLVLVSFVEHLNPPWYFSVEYWRYLCSILSRQRDTCSCENSTFSLITFRVTCPLYHTCLQPDITTKHPVCCSVSLQVTGSDIV